MVMGDLAPLRRRRPVRPPGVQEDPIVADLRTHAPTLGHRFRDSLLWKPIGELVLAKGDAKNPVTAGVQNEIRVAVNIRTVLLDVG
jgi:hypothetical protein